MNHSNLNYKSLFRTWEITKDNLSLINKFNTIIKLAIKVIFFRIELNDFLNSNNKILIINSQDRYDYKIQLLKYEKLFNSKSCNFVLVPSISINIINIIGYLISNKYKSLDIYQKLLIIFYNKSEKKLLSKIKNYKLIILFAEMQIYENFVVQICKIHNIKSVALQHGYYVEDYKNTINSINYKHIITDYFFAWGKSTKKLINKYNNNVNVLVVGRPSTHFLTSHAMNIDRHNRNITSIVAILDGNEFNYENNIIKKASLYISNNLNLKVFIKFHPSISNRKLECEYSEFVSNRQIGNFPIFVGNRSSLLIELAADGYKVFITELSPFNEKSTINYLYNNPYKIIKLSKESVKYFLNYSSPNSERVIIKTTFNLLKKI